MSIENRYRFQKATLAVRDGGERRLLHTIPVDSIVCLSSFSMDGRFVHVDYEGMGLMLFTQDFIERATLVEALPAPEQFFVMAGTLVN